MVTKKIISSVSELQEIQFYAQRAKEDVAIMSPDSKISVDAKSFIGLFGLDFSKSVLIVSEDEWFHKKIAGVGHTVTDEEE